MSDQSGGRADERLRARKRSLDSFGGPARPFAFLNDDAPSAGKRQRSEEESAPSTTFYEATHYEVDENNTIRGLHALHILPPIRAAFKRPLSERLEEQRKKIANRSLRAFSSTPAVFKVPPRVRPEEKRNMHSDSRASPIQWRSHAEVAIEVDEYKQAWALHDLVDENNINIMVLNKDHGIIQGPGDQVQKMIEKALEALGISGQDRIHGYIATVSGDLAYERRVKNRRGGLVDMKHQYIPMDWSKAEGLRAKKFPLSGGELVVVMEFRLTDKSEPGNLKPGRRLVLID